MNKKIYSLNTHEKNQIALYIWSCIYVQEKTMQWNDLSAWISRSIHTRVMLTAFCESNLLRYTSFSFAFEFAASFALERLKNSFSPFSTFPFDRWIVSKSHNQPRLENDTVHLVCGHREIVSSHSDNKLWVDIGETGELCLVEVHYEEFVGRSQFWGFRGELTIKVAYVLATFLLTINKKNISL